MIEVSEIQNLSTVQKALRKRRGMPPSATVCEEIEMLKKYEIAALRTQRRAEHNSKAYQLATQLLTELSNQHIIKSTHHQIINSRL